MLMGQKKKFIPNPEASKEDNAQEVLQRSINQAIGNTEVLWPLVKELQEKVAQLEKRVSDLEEDLARL